MITTIPAGRTPGIPPLKLFQERAEPAAEPGGKRPVAVIGAGFSGTIAALHLIRRLPADQPVLLCERAANFARGVAYATGESDHLLNVRASNMSALADEPKHFETWLRALPAPRPTDLYPTEAGLFASRGLYGSYLRSLLDEVMRETVGHAQLRLLPDDVVDLAAAGRGYELHTAGGQRIPICGAVLAIGNLPPEEDEDPRIASNPWGEKAWRPLDPEAPLLIVGTGLTMIDVVVSLRRRGYRGHITALSRGGLLPTAHAASDTVWPTPAFTVTESTTLSRLTRRLRDEIEDAAAQGVDWRAVIDSMRSITPDLWMRMPHPVRERFLRHARRYWDVHRHRMAPPHAALIEQMRRDGSLTAAAGRIRSMIPGPDGVAVRYTPRGGEPRTITVQRVIKASGLEQIGRTRDKLVQRLLDRGLARLDAHGFGLQVTDGLNLVHADGEPAEHLWALGPIVRGVFWECIAVPDIRVQAAQLSVSIVSRLREDAPRWSFNI